MWAFSEILMHVSREVSFQRSVQKTVKVNTYLKRANSRVVKLHKNCDKKYTHGAKCLTRQTMGKKRINISLQGKRNQNNEEEMCLFGGKTV